MYPVVLSIHVLTCLLVVMVVLLQSGKGAGFSGLFGGGSSDSLFNAPSGSMFLRKLTTGLAVAFFATSLFLTFLGARQHVTTVTRSMPMPVQMPAVPGADTAPAAQPEGAKAPEAPKAAAPAAEAAPKKK
jgi:preprotein translocase subunit SecG